MKAQLIATVLFVVLTAMALEAAESYAAPGGEPPAPPLAVSAAAAAQYQTRLKASDPATWRPVPDVVTVPVKGVTLDAKGLFKPVMDKNTEYLLKSFSVDDLLYPFRTRAGQKDPPRQRAPYIGYRQPGSNAARFLMGAGGTLRWVEHPELRRRMNAVVDGIEQCSMPNGFLMAYPPEGTLKSEWGNYARSWVTHGLLEAGIAGNPKALPLLRKYQDWFNRCEYLPKMIYLSLGLQGHIPQTRVYFSPVGKPEDLQVAEKYYVQDWWMDQLAALDPMAVWEYPLDRTHCYEVTGFEAYLDHYRATGDREYLDAMLGAWQLYHDCWEHVGGSMAICEQPGSVRGQDGRPDGYPPRSYCLRKEGETGETCGSVFWIKFNQRFHRLYPDQEKYVNEIEKSLYNIGLANQDPRNGSIRYHAYMQGRKDGGLFDWNTCCEGQGTRLFGSLPEYVYSIAGDGLYVNLFEPSSIEWEVGGRPVKLTMDTAFPFRPDVSLRVSVEEPVPMKLRVRVPAWAAADVPIRVGDTEVALGKPGTYRAIERTWSDGDTIQFTLPMEFRFTRYAGIDQIPWHTRYALECGPILMAAVGELDDNHCLQINRCPADLKTWLRPKPDQPLHFEIAGQPDLEYMPYWQVLDQTFTTFPIIEAVAIRGPDRFLDSATVELVSGVPGTSIHYTLDGSEPVATSPCTAQPLLIEETTLVRARLFAGVQPRSDVLQRMFRRIELLPPTIRPTPDGTSVEMLMPPGREEATIHYTLDDTPPAVQSPAYTGPIPLPAKGTTIRARAILPGRFAGSEVSFTVAEDSTGTWPQPDVYLSDLDVEETQLAQRHWHPAKMDRNVAGNVLSLGGRQYEKGIGIHGRSELSYAIKLEYTRFVALVGIDDQTNNQGNVTFEVYVDDRLIYETPVIRPKELWHIDVPLPPGGKTLRTVVTVGSDGRPDNDWGDWINAGFQLHGK